MSDNKKLKALKAIASVKGHRQLTLQEKWQIDAELAKKRRKKNNESILTGPVIGKKVSSEEMKKILQET